MEHLDQPEINLHSSCQAGWWPVSGMPLQIRKAPSGHSLTTRGWLDFHPALCAWPRAIMQDTACRSARGGPAVRKD